MSPQALAQAFAAVFPAELPDKTMVATIVLVARYRRPLLVWMGAIAAFSVHVVIAVAAGSAISLLPERLVKAAVAAMFTIGAVLLLRAARGAGDTDDDELRETQTDGARAALLGSFGLIVLAEWGDLTQLATTSLAASSGEPIATAIGALLALGAVAAIAATFGRQLIARVPIQRVNYIAAGIFAALAAWTMIDLAT